MNIGVPCVTIAVAANKNVPITSAMTAPSISGLSQFALFFLSESALDFSFDTEDESFLVAILFPPYVKHKISITQP